MRPVLLLVVLSLVCVARTAAQTVLPPEKEKIAVEAMSRLKSPYTPFHTVDMCPSAPALRDSIRVMAANGMSSEAIVEDVISRHGEQLRILPKRSGVGLVAWIATPLLLIVGATLIAVRLRRGQREAPLPAAAAPLTDEDRTELAAALREWDERGAGDA
jgi:cytochrome c-type biogenesis protein CcmH/NrfF